MRINENNQLALNPTFYKFTYALFLSYRIGLTILPLEAISRIALNKFAKEGLVDHLAHGSALITGLFQSQQSEKPAEKTSSYLKTGVLFLALALNIVRLLQVLYFIFVDGENSEANLLLNSIDAFFNHPMEICYLLLQLGSIEPFIVPELQEEIKIKPH